jgi:hypothetical protein
MPLGNNNKIIVKTEIIVTSLRFSCEQQGAT